MPIIYSDCVKLDVFRLFKAKIDQKNLEAAIKSYSGASPSEGIKRIGLLIDTTETDQLESITEMASGITPHSQVTTLCYVQRVKKGFHTFSTFDMGAVNWKGDLKHGEIGFFMGQSFDLLISYYSQDNILLRYITAAANAHFKVGFPIKNVPQLNDLVINIDIDEVSGLQLNL